MATKALSVRYSFKTTPRRIVFISGIPEPKRVKKRIMYRFELEFKWERKAELEKEITVVRPQRSLEGRGSSEWEVCKKPDCIIIILEKALTHSLGRDELAKERTEEDEDKREGDPGQVLQRKAGLHLGIGPLVGCRNMNTEPGTVRV